MPVGTHFCRVHGEMAVSLETVKDSENECLTPAVRGGLWWPGCHIAQPVEVGEGTRPVSFEKP